MWWNWWGKIFIRKYELRDDECGKEIMYSLLSYLWTRMYTEIFCNYSFANRNTSRKLMKTTAIESLAEVLQRSKFTLWVRGTSTWPRNEVFVPKVFIGSGQLLRPLKCLQMSVIPDNISSWTGNVHMVNFLYWE